MRMEFPCSLCVSWRKGKSFFFLSGLMSKATTRILVMEDIRPVRESVSLSLEMTGYTAMVTGTSREGLHHHGKFQASLIMKKVVGWKDGEGELPWRVSRRFFRTSRMMTLTENIPSSDGNMTFFHQFSQPICTLQKPFTRDEFLQTVQRVLAH